MSIFLNYPAPAAAEDFVAGDVLGLDVTTVPLLPVVRRIVDGDDFAGTVTTSADRTGLTVGDIDSLEGSVLAVQIISDHRSTPAAAVVPVWGTPCYAFSPTEFTHDSDGGARAFIGILRRLWPEGEGDYTIDCTSAYFGAVGQG